MVLRQVWACRAPNEGRRGLICFDLTLPEGRAALTFFVDVATYLAENYDGRAV